MDNKRITAMTAGGKILGEVLSQVVDSVKPGMTELDVDKLAEKLIRAAGGEPGFMKVPGYSHTICAATNDVVVHGIPTKRVLKHGDIIGVDCGVYLDGFHTDMAETIIVREADKKIEDEEKIKKFLKVGKDSMLAGIAQAKGGNRVGHISQAIQEMVEGSGFSVVRNLVGHGVGEELHMDPEIPGYLEKKITSTPLLKPGMTIAVEVIYNMGDEEVVYQGNDGWTIVTADGKLAGMFERTILVTEKDPIILTPGTTI
jgi:methionyl aminopeptidase